MEKNYECEVGDGLVYSRRPETTSLAGFDEGRERIWETWRVCGRNKVARGASVVYERVGEILVRSTFAASVSVVELPSFSFPYQKKGI